MDSDVVLMYCCLQPLNKRHLVSVAIVYALVLIAPAVQQNKMMGHKHIITGSLIHALVENGILKKALYGTLSFAAGFDQCSFIIR